LAYIAIEIRCETPVSRNHTADHTRGRCLALYSSLAWVLPCRPVCVYTQVTMIGPPIFSLLCYPVYLRTATGKYRFVIGVIVSLSCILPICSKTAAPFLLQDAGRYAKVPTSLLYSRCSSKDPDLHFQIIWLYVSSSELDCAIHNLLHPLP